MGNDGRPKRSAWIVRRWKRWNKVQRAVAVALVTFLTLLLLAAGTTAGMYVSGGRELREGVEAQESIIYQGHTYERNDDVVDVHFARSFDGKRQSKGHPGQLDTMIIVGAQATVR